MADLSTTYMGIPLRNPLIVASSNLTSTVDKIRKCEDAGAGAVVLKSLFEEQILVDMQKMISGSSDMGSPDGWDFLVNSSRNYYLDDYLALVENAKKAVSIPVIASVNCVSDGEWIDYAEKFEAMGADGLELNTFVIPSNVKKDASDYGDIYLKIARDIKKKVKLPVAMKVSPHFTDMAGMMDRLARAGVDALVLFNRFYRPDVDIRKMEMKHAPVLSAPEEIYMSLQWIALLSGEIETDFCASTGIFDAEGVIKQLLVGARGVQLCSALIRQGLGILPGILNDLSAWMEEKGFASVADFNGKLCQEASSRPEIYERNQYIRGVVGIS